MVHTFDFLVIGSGIAGMSLALKVADKGKVAIICKTELEEANTYYAQGGIASVTNLLVDNFDKHIEDTMIAGDWINDRNAVEMVVRNAPEQINELIKWGVNFDKNEKGVLFPVVGIVQPRGEGKLLVLVFYRQQKKFVRRFACVGN